MFLFSLTHLPHRLAHPDKTITQNDLLYNTFFLYFYAIYTY